MSSNQENVSESVNQPTGTVDMKEASEVVKTKKGEPKGKKMKNGTSKKARTWAVTDRTIKSAAIRNLKLSISDERQPGHCLVKTCKTKTVGKSQWCQTHKKLIRKEQLRLNNRVWIRRVKNGTAKHHVVYKDRPTAWAATHRDEALKLVKKGKSIVEPKEFHALMKKTQSMQRSRRASA